MLVLYLTVRSKGNRVGVCVECRKRVRLGTFPLWKGEVGIFPLWKGEVSSNREGVEVHCVQVPIYFLFLFFFPLN